MKRPEIAAYHIVISGLRLAMGALRPFRKGKDSDHVEAKELSELVGTLLQRAEAYLAEETCMAYVAVVYSDGAASSEVLPVSPELWTRYGFPRPYGGHLAFRASEDAHEVIMRIPVPEMPPNGFPIEIDGEPWDGPGHRWVVRAFSDPGKAKAWISEI